METLREILLSSDPVSILRKLIANNSLRNLESTLVDLKMEIPAGYHHKDNLEHSIKVLETAISREENGADLILRTAALFHDIAKPATREFHPKGKVTFTSHDTVGAKMIFDILPKHSYSRSEIKLISTLIKFHMRSHTFKVGWTDSAVRRFEREIGSYEQLRRLIIILYSDVTTSREYSRTDIFKNIESFDKALERVRNSDKRASLRPALNGFEVSELLGVSGKDLGVAMSFLNKDENISLSREESIEKLVAFWKKIS